MTLKLWHDDIRKAPDNSWNWARTNDAAKELLLRQPYDEISMDHDMGLHDYDADELYADLKCLPEWSRPEEGWELVQWMLENSAAGIIEIPPKITIHSWNPYGAERMANMFRNAGYKVMVKPYLSQHEKY